MRADHVEPSFVEKLTKSRRARAFVLRIWIAVGFNPDDSLDHGVNSRPSGRLFALRIGRQIRGGRTEPAQIKRGQRHADDQTPKYPTTARHGSKVRRDWESRVLIHARDAYGILTFIGSVGKNVNSAVRLPKGRWVSILLASLGAGARPTSLRDACLPSLMDRLPSARHTESTAP